MLTYKRIAVVGSRKFDNYNQIAAVLDERLEEGDWIVSGGALGADTLAYLYAKKNGYPILVFHPRWHIPQEDGSVFYDAGAGFKRNRLIVEHADIVFAFYQKGRFGQGGTANTAMWARKLGKELVEYEQE